MKNKKGFTLLEIIISVGLIAVVMLFLFQLLTDVSFEAEHPTYAKENQVIRASVMRKIQQDFISMPLADVDMPNEHTIRFVFKDGVNTIEKTLDLSETDINYDDESWSVKGNEVKIDFEHISIVKNSASESDLCREETNPDLNITEEHCPTYKSVKIKIPIINESEDNIIDDIELFYIGENTIFVPDYSARTYYLTLDAKTGTNIEVNRTGTSHEDVAPLGKIGSGEAIYPDDQLTIIASAKEHYELTDVKVEGYEGFSKDNPSGSITVKGNVKVTATAKLKEYKLTLDARTGSNITVVRNSSLSGVASGRILNGATIYDGDKLTISASPTNTLQYNQPTIKVNNADFVSGTSYEVRGDTIVLAQTTAKAYTLTKSQGAGTTLKITRTSSPIGKGTINTTLENNATIYYNDVLKVEVSTATGYKDAKITAGGATLTSGGTKSVTGNMTISSSASLATYTISYNLDGGAHGASHPTTATYNTAFTVNNPTKTGYTFAGWNISGMDSTTHNYGNATTTATSLNGRKETSYKNLRASAGTVTFKATWTINTYNVAWNGNGGSVTNNGATRVQYNNNVGTLGTASRTGYTFNGWYTAASGGTKISTTTKVTGNVTYYAQWTVNKYYLDLNGLLDGNASGNTSGYGTFDVYINNNKVVTGVSDYYVQHPYGTKYEVKNVTAATGHTYNGVSSGSASGTIGAGNVSVQLKFTTNSYSVSWNGNGGTVTQSGATNVKYNNSVGSLGTATRSGYTFLGWFTAASGGSQISTSTKVTGNVTYYAHWRANNYTVSWNASGGSVSPASSTLTAGSKLGTLPTPIRLGFKFTGWYTAASGGNQINENTVPTGNVTYYAHWDKYCLQDYLDSPANKRPNGNNYITGFVGYITTNGNTFQFVIGNRAGSKGWRFSSNGQYSQPYKIRWRVESYNEWFCDGCYNYKQGFTTITSEISGSNRIVIEIYDRGYVGDSLHLVDIIYITHVDFDNETDDYHASWNCLHGVSGYSTIYNG